MSRVQTPHRHGNLNHGPGCIAFLCSPPLPFSLIRLVDIGRRGLLTLSLIKHLCGSHDYHQMLLYVIDVRGQFHMKADQLDNRCGHFKTQILNSFSSEALKTQAAFRFEGQCFEFLASEFDHVFKLDILELGILDFDISEFDHLLIFLSFETNRMNY